MATSYSLVASLLIRWRRFQGSTILIYATYLFKITGISAAKRPYFYLYSTSNTGETYCCLFNVVP